MADAKLTGLSEDTAPTTDDMIYTVTDPAGTPASRKVTLGNAVGAMSWEILGRHTLGSDADALSVTPIVVRKYLWVIACLVPNSTITAYMTFNGDATATNYNRKLADNNGANADAAGALLYTTTGTAQLALLHAHIVNIAAQNKIVFSESVADGGDGAVATKRVMTGQWENSADAITRVDLINDGAGSYAAVSELIVLGRN